MYTKNVWVECGLRLYSVHTCCTPDASPDNHNELPKRIYLALCAKSSAPCHQVPEHAGIQLVRDLQLRVLASIDDYIA